MEYARQMLFLPLSPITPRFLLLSIPCPHRVMLAHMTCFLNAFLTSILLLKVVMVPSAYSKTYQWELLFPASVPALGFSIYSVNKMSGHNHQAHNLTARPKKSKSRVLVIENKVRLLLDPLPCLRDKFKVL